MEIRHADLQIEVEDAEDGASPSSTTPIVSAKMETPAEALLTSPLRSGGHA